MKRAVILHGTSAEPMSGWRPWLKEKLEAEGYAVWIPSLPNNDVPNRVTYNNFLLNSDWDFTNNIVVGHSSGAVAILNLLMDARCPKIKLAIPVSAWNGKLLPGSEEMNSRMQDLFPKNGFDFEKIRSNVDAVTFIHNRFDPYCDPNDAAVLAESLEAELIMLNKNEGENANHLGSPITELPELWEVVSRAL